MKHELTVKEPGRMRRINVRCCCQPRKILGTLEAPGDAGDGSVRYFPVSEGCVIGATIKDSTIAPVKIIALPIAICSVGCLKELAYKSEETPIEILRQIRGFIERAT